VQLSSRLTLLRTLQSVPRWLAPPGLPRLAPALVLALAALVGWRALRPGAPQDRAPAPLAITPEPGASAQENLGASAPAPSAAPAATPPPAPVVTSVPRPTEAPPRTRPVVAPVRSQKASCKDPFWVDAKGIKRLKTDCLAADPGCEPPWFSDLDGVLRMKPNCSSRSGDAERPEQEPVPNTKRRRSVPRPPVAGCEPPWFVDPKGIMRLKPNCF
jgi:hypothetical protein